MYSSDHNNVCMIEFSSWASARKFAWFMWLATVDKGFLFFLATNKFVEPQNMFVKGVNGY